MRKVFENINAYERNGYVMELPLNGDFSGATVQIVVVNQSSGVGPTFEIVRSNDHATWEHFPEKQVIVGSGMSGKIDVEGLAYMGIRVNTTGMTATAWSVHVWVVCSPHR